MLVADLKRLIREVPDYPKPGVRFYDLTTLFARGDAFRSAVERLSERFRGDRVDLIAGVEARGFMLAAALAFDLRVGLIPIRKPGKLPWRTLSEAYALEYGEACVEIHEDAAAKGQRVLIVDDVLATGGTAAASARLVKRLGAEVAGFGFLVELDVLGGRALLESDNLFSLIHYV